MYFIVSLLISFFSAVSASNPAAGLFMYYWLYFNGFFSNPIPTNPVADVVGVIENTGDAPAADEQQTQPSQDTTVADEPQSTPEITTPPSPEGSATTPEAPAGIGFDANPSLSDEEETVFNDLNNLRNNEGLPLLSVSSHIQSLARDRLIDCDARNANEAHEHYVYREGFKEVWTSVPAVKNMAVQEWLGSPGHAVVVRDPTKRYVGIAVGPDNSGDPGFQNNRCVYAVLSAYESP